MKSLVILMEAVQWDPKPNGSGLKEPGWEGAERCSCCVRGLSGRRGLAAERWGR